MVSTQIFTLVVLAVRRSFLAPPLGKLRMSSCALLLLPRVALLALLELEGQPQTFFFRILGLVGRRALAAPLAHRRRRLARVAVRARVPVRRQGRARRRRRLARGGGGERERPFRAVGLDGRVLGVASHFVLCALGNGSSGALTRRLAALGLSAVPQERLFFRRALPSAANASRRSTA